MQYYADQYPSISESFAAHPSISGNTAVSNDNKNDEYFEVNRCYSPASAYQEQHAVAPPPITSLAFGSGGCLYSAANARGSSTRSMRSNNMNNSKNNASGGVSMMYVHEEDTLELYSSVAAHPILKTNSVLSHRHNRFSSGNYHDGGIFRIVPLVNYIPDESTIAEPGSNRETRPFALSVSSAGVRAHTRGGLKLCEFSVRGTSSGKDNGPTIETTAAAIHPYVEQYGTMPTHLTCATTKSGYTATSTSQQNKNVFCLDIYAGLKEIASIKLCSSNRAQDISSMETNLQYNCLVAGTNQGILRIIDGNLSAKGDQVMASAGGIATISAVQSLATWGDYAVVPELQCLNIFDIRMLSRGIVASITTEFATRKICFMHSDNASPCILSASDHCMRLYDVNTCTPLNETIWPNLDTQHGERISSIAVLSSQDIQKISNDSNQYINTEKIAIGTTHAAMIMLGKGIPTLPKRTPFSIGHLCKPPLYPPIVENDHSKSITMQEMPFAKYTLRYSPMASDVKNTYPYDQKRKIKPVIPHSKRLFNEVIRNLMNGDVGNKETQENVFSCPMEKLIDIHSLSKPKDKSNPNQFLYNPLMSNAAYDTKADPRTSSSRDLVNKLTHTINPYVSSNFTEGLFPGWDCANLVDSQGDSYAAPILMMLFFTPEIRKILLSETSPDSKSNTLEWHMKVLCTQLQSATYLAGVSMSSHPPESDEKSLKMTSALQPADFIMGFKLTQEAVALNFFKDQDMVAKIRGFYRFLLHYLDNGWSKLERVALSAMPREKCFDALQGMTFVSTSQFAKSQKCQSEETHSRLLSLDLNFDSNYGKSTNFVDLLLKAILNERTIRVRNHSTLSFETATQTRHIQVSPLPTLLSLTLEEIINVEVELPLEVNVALYGSGHVVVKSTNPDYVASSTSEIPDKVEAKFSQHYKLTHAITHQLNPPSDDDPSRAFYTLHTRVLKSTLINARKSQIAGIDKVLSCSNPYTNGSLFSNELLNKRKNWINEEIKRLHNEQRSDFWYEFFGKSARCMSNNDVVSFRRFTSNGTVPCLVQYRSSEKDMPIDEFASNPKNFTVGPKIVAMDTEFVKVQGEQSTLTASGQKFVTCEGRNALARLSILHVAYPGSKFNDGDIFVDIYVKPQEPVVDYLTRFSGITADHLNPDSKHGKTNTIVDTRTAYLHLRALIDQGCVFIGHGLAKDFQVLNLQVSPHQIIDTVMLYHLPRRRWISLRFLVNYLFQRDMQREVHDSVEDARAALELFRLAERLNSKGNDVKLVQNQRGEERTEEFEHLLTEIYQYGKQVDWKVA